MKQRGKIVVWPANLDSTKSRIEGRKVPKALAIQAPRLEEISEGAKRLSLEVDITAGKSQPRSWWEKGGYAIIAKKETKGSVLRALAAEIRKARAAKTEQPK
ncbi:MAG TPA: signal recognition particle subunit SRP19/SEC65 family protein [Candidatus Acidoferrum sp.]|nr:signal recognition particle subunit SRP19/SEC65 family protein [Candidatus Acidoferrum sp.]